MEVDENEETFDGTIQSIHVRNFFCHDNLEINLNRNVNIIVGRNGSGKSAILTALVVGLGCRASATNRGNNLQSFIKKGANSGTVEIKIKNSSVTAYKPDIYGDCITVVRTINSSGGSSYKVKSASGDVKSTKVEDVNAIITAHNIQVDNPVSVLNQDEAQIFHDSTPKQKYALYRRATNLEKTEENYNIAIEKCQKASYELKRKQVAFEELAKEYKKWKASYEQMQSRDEMEVHKKKLQNEFYWSEIVDMEKEARLRQIDYDKKNDTVNKLVEKLQKLERHFGSNTDTIDQLKRELTSKREEKASIEQELRNKEEEERELKNTWRSTQTTLLKHNELIKRERGKIVDLEREISNIDSGSAASRRAELEAKAKAAAEAAAEVTQRYNTAGDYMKQARGNSAHAVQEADRARERANRERDSIRKLKQELRELESRGNESLGVYGNNMAELVKRVKQATQRGVFSAEPRGPVGSFLKVKDKKWGGALEHIIGGSIQSFCVNSPDDSRALFQIMGQVYGNAAKPAVTCSKFLNRVHDVQRNKVRARGFMCALDAVEVNDPVVANYLIDNMSMEAILLVPDHESAVRLSDTEENVPENCAKIVTLDSSEYFPAPSYRSYGGAGKHARYLLSSTGERRRQVQQEIQETEKKLTELEQAAEKLTETAKQAQRAEQEAGRQLQALMGAKHTADEGARVAAAALDSTTAAPHHAVLVDELKISKDKLVELRGIVEQLSAKEQKSKEKTNEFENIKRELESRLQKLTQECRSKSEEIDHEQLKQERGSTERQAAQRKLREDRDKLAQVKQRLDEKYAQIQAKVDEATQLCPRIDAPREKSVVEAELAKTVQKLSSYRSDGMSKAQVADKLLHVERKYRRNQYLLDKLRTMIQEVRKTAEEHLKICHKVQTNIARWVQKSFQAMLSLRNTSGSMEIDNAKSTLSIFSTGHDSSGKRQAATTSSMSGGERSYATVAFLMALWDCVELPFYFLDEFDVFMDGVTRKIVLDLLVGHAVKNRSRQFVFLTPQDTTVEPRPEISFHRMSDPRP